MPKDFGSVDPQIYDALRSEFGLGRSIRYFLEGDNCSRISVASDEGPIYRDIPISSDRRRSLGQRATELLSGLNLITDEAGEWLFADGFALHSITFDTRQVHPAACHRQPRPHFDFGRALFTGEHFGPTYLIDDKSGTVAVDAEGGRLVGHNQTNLHYSRPSPLATRQSRAVVKVSAVESSSLAD